MFVLMLFGHIVGALTLSAAFALDWVALRELRRSGTLEGTTIGVNFTRVLPALYRVASIDLFLTGAYMASRIDGWQYGWIRVSLAALIGLAIIGTSSGRRVRPLDPALGRAKPGDASHHRDTWWLMTSFRLRVATALAIVYLMVAKPDAVWSLIVVIAAALAGAATTIRSWRPAGRAHAQA